MFLLPYPIKLLVLIRNWHFNTTFETVGEGFGCLFVCFKSSIDMLSDRTGRTTLSFISQNSGDAF